METKLSRICVRCQHGLPDDANVCPQCGHDYRPAMMGHAWEDERTPLPPIGGALIALSGVSQIMAGLLWLDGFAFGIGSDSYTYDELYWAIGFVMIFVGAFAVFAGPFAMTRRRLTLSLSAGLVGLGGTLATLYALSISLGLVGLVGILMIALARDEFVD